MSVRESVSLPAPGALAGIRVVEVGSALTNYCGKLFAELGADVVLVEPVGGSDVRREPPFVAAADGDDVSTSFFCHNTSKRSIALDLDRPGGVDAFRRLVATADVVLDGQPPGWFGARELGFDELSASRPALVMTSASPFGQTGPYAHDAHSARVCGVRRAALARRIPRRAIGHRPASRRISPRRCSPRSRR